MSALRATTGLPLPTVATTPVLAAGNLKHQSSQVISCSSGSSKTSQKANPFPHLYLMPSSSKCLRMMALVLCSSYLKQAHELASSERHSSRDDAGFLHQLSIFCTAGLHELWPLVQLPLD